MIELKVYVPQDGPYGLVPEEGGAPVEEETCYLKSEVDRVIAELRWRKCSEEMPEEDAPVLFSDGNYIYKGCWTTWDGGHSDFSYETFSGWVEDGSEQDYDFNEIKYWMPLPKAPEEVQ